MVSSYILVLRKTCGTLIPISLIIYEFGITINLENHVYMLVALHKLPRNDWSFRDERHSTTLFKHAY